MHLIADTGSLRALCERLAGSRCITVDTEFMRDRTYWPRLCLVQPRLGRRSGGGRCARSRHRSRTAAGADAGLRCAQGVPRRPPGHRNLLPSRRPRPDTRVRHADRSDGLRLRRSGRLRTAGRQAGARFHRQDRALHRLGAAAPDEKDVRLRDFRRHPSSRRLRKDCRPARQQRARGMARRGDGGADRPGDLPHGTRGGLAPGQDPLAQAAPTRRSARTRGMARGRGAASRCAP